MLIPKLIPCKVSLLRIVSVRKMNNKKVTITCIYTIICPRIAIQLIKPYMYTIIHQNRFFTCVMKFEPTSKLFTTISLWSPSRSPQTFPL